MGKNNSFVGPDELELRLSSTSSSPSDRRRQKMTIFYDGRVIASDLTGSQARAIIELAKKEVDGNKEDCAFPAAATPAAPASPAAQLMNPGQSMKRSLQRFLQKRKARIADLSCPYGGHRRLPLMQLFS